MSIKTTPQSDRLAACPMETLAQYYGQMPTEDFEIVMGALRVYDEIVNRGLSETANIPKHLQPDFAAMGRTILSLTKDLKDCQGMNREFIAQKKRDEETRHTPVTSQDKKAALEWFRDRIRSESGGYVRKLDDGSIVLDDTMPKHIFDTIEAALTATVDKEVVEVVCDVYLRIANNPNDPLAKPFMRENYAAFKYEIEQALSKLKGGG